MFERQTHWIDQQLTEIAARFNAADPSTVELHGSPMYGGKGEWRSVPKVERVRAIMDALGVARNAQQSIRLFGVAIHKPSIGREDPIEHAFEQLCNRFDLLLMRLHRKGDTQRGLIVCDKSVKETSLQTLARDFKSVGHRWGVLRNLSEVPVFVDSRASRLVQLADLIAWSLFRAVERGDRRFLEVIEGRFDAVAGVRHGLVVTGPAAPTQIPLPDPVLTSAMPPAPLAEPPPL